MPILENLVNFVVRHFNRKDYLSPMHLHICFIQNFLKASLCFVRAILPCFDDDNAFLSGCHGNVYTLMELFCGNHSCLVKQNKYQILTLYLT